MGKKHGKGKKQEERGKNGRSNLWNLNYLWQSPKSKPQILTVLSADPEIRILPS